MFKTARGKLEIDTERVSTFKVYLIEKRVALVTG